MPEANRLKSNDYDTKHEKLAPLVGGLFFMLLGMVFTIYFQTDRAAANFLMISMPLLVAGVLFIFSHAGSPQKPVF